MKNVIIVFVFISLALAPDIALSQASWYFGVYAGAHAMKDYKETQKSLGGVGKNFPISIGYQMEISWMSSFNRFGFYTDYTQTTSTASQDESMTAKRYLFGILDHAHIGHNFSIGARLGFNYSTLTTSNINYTGWDFGGVHNPSFFSMGVTFEPFLAWTHGYKTGDLRIALGYEINGQEESCWTKNSDIAMVTPSQKESKANWNGFRLNLAYGFHVGRQWRQ